MKDRVMTNKAETFYCVIKDKVEHFLNISQFDCYLLLNKDTLYCNRADLPEEKIKDFDYLCKVGLCKLSEDGFYEEL